jgi:carboxypeptidase Taq
MTTPAYDALAAHWLRLHHLEHLNAIAYWDQAVNMPPKSHAARAAALAEMAALLHRLRTDRSLPDRLARAEQEPLDDLQRANLREMQREWRLANALPESLVQRSQLAASRCEHAWRTQRPANDWAGFVANFRDVLALAREQAAHLGDHGGLSKYDALLDRHEPGMTSATLERVFGDLRQWLPDLIRRVLERQARDPVTPPAGPFALDAQRRLCERVLGLLGFDFGAGRLDVSTHPFCGGVPQDVRVTTRFATDDFLGSLMGTIHECGHARYEQNLPHAWLGQPVAQARSVAIHESQSLSFEMQLAAHPGFARVLAPLVADAFGARPAFEAPRLHRLLTRVAPGRIRVDADEVTYPAHVLLRYEIERALIEGDAEADDIPALWDAKMQQLLGIDTRGDYRDGPLQDVHWPEGIFGYFPCYTLGAMYAAQWFAAIRRQRPDLDECIGRGDLAPVFDWLRQQVWTPASRWTTDELVRRASGETLNPAHYRAHLEARYL